MKSFFGKAHEKIKSAADTISKELELDEQQGRSEGELENASTAKSADGKEETTQKRKISGKPDGMEDLTDEEIAMIQAKMAAFEQEMAGTSPIVPSSLASSVPSQRVSPMPAL